MKKVTSIVCPTHGVALSRFLLPDGSVLYLCPAEPRQLREYRVLPNRKRGQ